MEPCPDCAAPKLLPENEEAAALFGICDTQWLHVDKMRTGINFAGVQAAAEMAEISMTKDLFAKIRMMERWTLGIDCEKVERNRGN